ncbi:MAG TPA: potassium transporter TrkG [Pirellulaceae bacterium]|nr:potassium transporter TrkG [Pirellulaceae bacterium]
MRSPSTTDPTAARDRLALRVLWAERLLTAFTIAVLVLGHGVQRLEAQLGEEIGTLVLAVMALLTAGFAWRAWLNIDWREFLAERRPQTIVHAIWLAGLLLAAFSGVPGLVASGKPLDSVLRWTELLFWARTLVVAIRILRLIAAARTNPAFVFVASFAVLIGTGTLLLMLPAARVQPAGSSDEIGAPPLVALFTATSASCVTGLVVVDTGAYWTRTGQGIILALIQLGGLGVMTFGAFFALAQRRGFLVREGVFMGQLLEADDRRAVRRLVASILVFTFASELIGAALVATAAPGGTLGERAWFGVFHAISAFCNAGFGLLPKNLEGLGGRWQIWGVVAPLIVIGGLGFEVLRNLAQVILARLAARWPRRDPEQANAPPRLTATTRLVVATTAALLAAGTIAFFILERDVTLRDLPLGERLAASWFQSVTFRTAGFNTVDFTRLAPGTRLIGIVLMFIGASPGSTGGGIKTVVFALLVLVSAATIRGRERVEFAGRTIPDGILKRAAVVAGLAAASLLTSTLLIVIFEQRPELFLDHLFEAASALGTVGLSTVNTATLRPISQCVLVATMFAGRVGPLTLLVALAQPRPQAKYEYPSERVMLG